MAQRDDMGLLTFLQAIVRGFDPLCEDCIFSKANAASILICHRIAPWPGPAGVAEWPIVQPAAVCGEWIEEVVEG